MLGHRIRHPRSLAHFLSSGFYQHPYDEGHKRCAVGGHRALLVVTPGPSLSGTRGGGARGTRRTARRGAARRLALGAMMCWQRCVGLVAHVVCTPPFNH
jgi:hypothetical protein